FLDDFIYQSMVRGMIKKELQKSSISPYNLIDSGPQMERELNMMMRQVAAVQITKYFPQYRESGIHYSFPWNRIFEVEIML
ncbi:MAG: DUF4127 family protein, partial [bacterium]